MDFTQKKKRYMTASKIRQKIHCDKSLLLLEVKFGDDSLVTFYLESQVESVFEDLKLYFLPFFPKYVLVLTRN